MLGRERVFVDVDSIDPGEDFVAAIWNAVSQCDVVLVVIGRSWLMASTEDGVRRLDLADDFVRLEVESAFRCGIRVVPLLVQGASMPSEPELPDSLRPLSRRNAVTLHDTQWSRDLDHLVRKLCTPDEHKQPQGLGTSQRPRLLPSESRASTPSRNHRRYTEGSSPKTRGSPHPFRATICRLRPAGWWVAGGSLWRLKRCSAQGRFGC
jgi:hypothetical protein